MTGATGSHGYGLEDARSILRTVFGFPDFRPGQAPVVDAVLAGRDVLAILPTGAGKSVCYQAPALLGQGLTVVVSPLLALMRDQVLALRQLGVAAAAATSDQGAEERQAAIRDAVNGRLRLLYVSPERLADPWTLSQLQRAPLARLAIDEAHCVSQWGFDFRPSYGQLTAARAALGNPQTIAFTATADELVRDDIVAQLGLRDPAVIVGGFDRPNLHFVLERVHTLAERQERVISHLRAAPGQSAIVYSATRRRVDELAAALSLAGIRAAGYHAGMEDRARRKVQDDFAQDRVPVIVATIAFGMGIDKPDVRLVIHHSLPDSIEAYYQEAGRAGRDGEPARCILLYQAADHQLRIGFINRGHPTARQVVDVYERLVRARGEWVDLDDLNEHEFPGAVAACQSLVQSGLVVLDRGAARALRPGGASSIDTAAIEEHRNVAIARLDSLIAYATSRTCLRARLLSYFGERPPRGCGNCSVCVASRAPVSPSAARTPEDVLEGPEEALFEVLRTWRTGVARETQMPPYVIFHDSVLRTIARRGPRTAGDLRGLPGIGPVKLERYGKAILDVVAQSQPAAR